jgi:hypothetical protein
MVGKARFGEDTNHNHAPLPRGLLGRDAGPGDAKYDSREVASGEEFESVRHNSLSNDNMMC